VPHLYPADAVIAAGAGQEALQPGGDQRLPRAGRREVRGTEVACGSDSVVGTVRGARPRSTSRT
jgi:hypothetical protein